MIKKITLILFLLTFVISCGKKSDPKYIDSQKSTLKESILIKKV